MQIILLHSFLDLNKLKNIFRLWKIWQMASLLLTLLLTTKVTRRIPRAFRLPSCGRTSQKMLHSFILLYSVWMEKKGNLGKNVWRYECLTAMNNELLMLWELMKNSKKLESSSLGTAYLHSPHYTWTLPSFTVWIFKKWW